MELSDAASIGTELLALRTIIEAAGATASVRRREAPVPVKVAEKLRASAIVTVLTPTTVTESTEAILLA